MCLESNFALKRLSPCADLRAGDLEKLVMELEPSNGVGLEKALVTQSDHAFAEFSSFLIHLHAFTRRNRMPRMIFFQGTRGGCGKGSPKNSLAGELVGTCAIPASTIRSCSDFTNCSAQPSCLWTPKLFVRFCQSRSTLSSVPSLWTLVSLGPQAPQLLAKAESDPDEARWPMAVLLKIAG